MSLATKKTTYAWVASVMGYYPYFDHSILNSVGCDNHVTLKQLAFASPETILYHRVKMRLHKSATRIHSANIAHTLNIIT